jgi:anaerobic ribonucleoside-triphosphate reductase activating protein
LLRVARCVPATDAEGPFPRYALWVQGCALQCPGCCNPDMLGGDRGTWKDVDAIAGEIRCARHERGIEGITVLGGEPLEQIAAVTAIAESVGALGLGVIVFTGHTEAEARQLPGFDRLWRALDTLVDGPFDARQREPAGGRRFVGSRNQRLVHRTSRYRKEALWIGESHAEIRIASDGTTTVHGVPRHVDSLLRAW